MILLGRMEKLPCNKKQIFGVLSITAIVTAIWCNITKQFVC